ncbi:DNA adenine methylase [Sphingomonas sp. ERG5]|uniref:DNA adenine methylase n=1 Tax=Sphingomonas sp. ERG5 TaxID=1381597 RepID=UPI0009DE0E09|nr:DNA adenine methylase [Sphingomonas sp. ERG5]
MVQRAFDLPNFSQSPEEAFAEFPSTRYQGSKRKLLPFLYEACKSYDFHSVLDLYSGTSSVSLMFRYMGKRVTANDYMLYNWTTAKILLNATNDWLGGLDMNSLIEGCFESNNDVQNVVGNRFAGIYFPDEENEQVDLFCANLSKFPPEQADLLIYLMGQSMLMKRPYNLFHRANLEMRTKDVPRSFGNAKTWETPFATHMLKLAKRLQKCQFRGPAGVAYCINSNDIGELPVEPDLIYLDPPYLNKANVPVDYSTFYHFLDGLVDYALFSQGNDKYPHKPIALKPSRWRTPDGGLAEISDILRRWPTARIAISYRGDGRPSIADLKAVLGQAGYIINEHTAVDYKYALSKNFDATEDLIIGTPSRLT